MPNDQSVDGPRERAESSTPVDSNAEIRYRSTLDSLLEGFQIISADWKYLYVNSAAAQHGRRRPEELLGRTMWEVYPGFEQTPIFAVLKRCMTERTSASLENLFAFPDRTTCWFELRVQPVPEGLAILSVDIQQRKDAEAALRRLADELETEVGTRTRDLEIAKRELEARVAERTAALAEANARLRSVIESAVDGIVVVNADGRIEAFNPAAARMFGYDESDVVGQNVKILMPPPYHDEHDSYLTRYLTTGVPKIIGKGRDVTGRRRDGSVFPVHLSVGEMPIGGERKFTGILHDLSERAALEKKLRDQAVLAQLGEMATVLAHEVENPIAGVRGAIEIIASRLPPNSRDGAVMKEIVARLDSLAELMKNVVVFGRPRDPRPAPVDCAALLHKVASELQQDPANEQLLINIRGSTPMVMADAELLTIVFRHLVSNASQAVDGRGEIGIDVAADQDACRVAISDTGPGIPADVHAKLFTPFFTTKARGTGLGLATAKRFVEAHGGTIAVESAPERGTTVTVSLPLHAS